MTCASRPARPGALHCGANRPLGRLPQGAGGIALCVANDLPARRVRRLGGDPGQLQCHCVGERCVTAGVGEKDGVQRRDPGKALVDRQPLDRGLRRPVPLLLVPAPAENPVAGLGVSYGDLDHGDDLVPVGGPGQVERHLGESEVGEVAVAFDESGNRQPAVQVDDLGRLSHVRGDFLVASHRDDSIAGHRDGLGFGNRIVHSDDPSVPEYQVGRREYRGHRRGSARHQQTHHPDRAKKLRGSFPVHRSRLSRFAALPGRSGRHPAGDDDLPRTGLLDWGDVTRSRTPGDAARDVSASPAAWPGTVPPGRRSAPARSSRWCHRSSPRRGCR